MKEEKTQKKPWQKPELQILVRCKPDEAVLQACKTVAAGATPNQIFGGCQWAQPNGEDFVCFDCDAITLS